MGKSVNGNETAACYITAAGMGLADAGMVAVDCGSAVVLSAGGTVGVVVVLTVIGLVSTILTGTARGGVSGSIQIQLFDRRVIPLFHNRNLLDH